MVGDRLVVRPLPLGTTPYLDGIDGETGERGISVIPSTNDLGEVSSQSR